MREIKFRGINMEGQWVYGYLGKDWDNDVSITTNFDSDVLCSCEYKVIPESVGQYTGLKDKNGREIYEGDILQHPNGTIAEIKYLDDLAAFVAVYALSGKIEMDYLDKEIINKCEIVWNRYESKQLLEGEK